MSEDVMMIDSSPTVGGEDENEDENEAPTAAAAVNRNSKHGMPVVGGGKSKDEEEKKDSSSPKTTTKKMTVEPTTKSPPTKKQAIHSTSSSSSASSSIKDVESILQELRSGVDNRPIGILPLAVPENGGGGGGHRRRTRTSQLCDYSVLKQKLKEITTKMALSTSNANDTDAATTTINYWSSLIEKAISNDKGLDRAVGCMMGMIAGDSVGAPLEFTPASSTSIDERRRKNVPSTTTNNDHNNHYDDSFVVFDAKEGDLIYHNEKNAFALQRGQWTDDASMGICMAESMLARDRYVGGDVRVRFHLWWSYGYCNAFRYDQERTHRGGGTSVGLGGNISQSLQNLIWHYNNKMYTEIPARFEATGEDAGNGSLMRLAPIPIRYHSNINLAMTMAEESSYATHPGPDASNCCRFVAYFICRAIHRTNDTPNENGDDIVAFTNQIIHDYLQGEDATKQSTKLQSLLLSKPPSPKEACWDWKSAEKLAIEETLTARGCRYNGYPVSAEYFGSYCMDGLAMALWALTHSRSLPECILHTVNLRGDADTTGSIAGQLAGAYYGYQHSFLRLEQQKEKKEEEACSSLNAAAAGRCMIRNIRQWDPIHNELELRALLLYKDGAKEEGDDEESS